MSEVRFVLESGTHRSRRSSPSPSRWGARHPICWDGLLLLRSDLAPNPPDVRAGILILILIPGLWPSPGPRPQQPDTGERDKFLAPWMPETYPNPLVGLLGPGSGDGQRPGIKLGIPALNLAQISPHLWLRPGLPAAACPSLPHFAGNSVRQSVANENDPHRPNLIF